MRIGTRLFISVAITLFLVLGVGAALRLHDERELLHEATLQDRRFFGETLQAVLSQNAFSDPAEIPRLLGHDLKPHDASVSLSVEPLSRVAQRLPSDMVSELRRAHVTATAKPDGSATTYIPLAHAGELWIVELAERDGSFQRFFQSSLFHSVVSALALASVLGLVVWVLTGRLVSKPLWVLGHNARRLAQGELSARIELRGDDELTEFASELNTMAEKLEAAQKRLDEETSTRITLLEQLRHADRLRMVGMLSSSLAHELGTPLNVVFGHARLIERAPDISAPLRERAHIIAEQVQRMTAILQNVLGFARAKGPARARVELSDIAAHAINMLEPMARKQQVQIDLDARDQGPVVADQSQVMQALTNLMVNAIHAMPQGGKLVLRIDRESHAPNASGERDGAYATLAVIDQGTGVNPAHLPHLFEPFFTTKKSSEGTGLGLTVTSGIVQDHGGFIDVKSELGQGSTFTIHLPLAEPAQA